MNGWNSRHDRENQSNNERLCGRILHTQENNWLIGKILLGAFLLLCIYILKNEGDLFRGIRFFAQFLGN
jgi:hypothetical protein